MGDAAYFRPVIHKKFVEVLENFTDLCEIVDESVTFDDVLGLDSMDMIELGMAVEEEFKIKIADEEWEKVKTVGDAVTLIEGKGWRP